MKTKETKAHETIIKREYEKPVLILLDTIEKKTLLPTTGAAS
jgi:hypothetical protein